MGALLVKAPEGLDKLVLGLSRSLCELLGLSLSRSLRDDLEEEPWSLASVGIDLELLPDALETPDFSEELFAGFPFRCSFSGAPFLEELEPGCGLLSLSLSGLDESLEPLSSLLTLRSSANSLISSAVRSLPSFFTALALTSTGSNCFFSASFSRSANAKGAAEGLGGPAGFLADALTPLPPPPPLLLLLPWSLRIGLSGSSSGSESDGSYS